ncbi:MAG: NADP-dependent oxidoreductase [Actinomycetota bacterium]
MRAFTLDRFDSPPAFRDDLAEPTLGDGRLLVRVHASSVNPVDGFIGAGALKEMAEHEFPVILGRDYAGVVERVGSGVVGYAPGDEVFGFLVHADPVVHAGTWAELTLVPHDSVAAKPRSVDFEHAGAAPLAAITAMAANDALALQAGETVLVVGASGGVGSFLVQLAAAAGASVIATALPEDEEYLRALGAGELVDRNADVSAAVRALRADGVDAVMDAVTSTPDTSVLREGGRLASPVGAAGEGPERFNVMGVSSVENIRRLAELLDAGTIRVPIQRSYPLERAGEALESLQAEHTQGKVGVTVV